MHHQVGPGDRLGGHPGIVHQVAHHFVDTLGPWHRAADQRPYPHPLVDQPGHQPLADVATGPGHEDRRHSPSAVLYQATVSARPSSKVWLGFHPSTARAFSADRYWWGISPEAVARMSGSKSVPTADCMSATTSSTVSGRSAEKLNASPARSGRAPMASASCR